MMYDDGRVLAPDNETYQLGLDIAGMLDRANIADTERWLLSIIEGRDYSLAQYFIKNGLTDVHEYEDRNEGEGDKK